MEIVPAVLEKNADDFIRAVSLLPSEVKLVHIDVLEEDVWSPIERDFEAHLMVKEPEKIIDSWIDRGAKAIIFHKPSPYLLGYKNRVRIGLGVEMDVPLEEVFPLVNDVNFIHLMSINEIGEQGHPLDERIFDRIRAVRERFPYKTISVDGGVNISNYRRLTELGADVLVVGSGFQELWQTLQMKK